MNWLRRMMIGRYGQDRLNYTLIVTSLVSLLLNNLTGWRFFWMLALVTLAISYLRMFSRDTARRYQENQRFMQLLGRVRPQLAGAGEMIRNIGRYRHFRCPSCKQKLRAPRGKGKISVHCHNCHIDFITKT